MVSPFFTLSPTATFKSVQCAYKVVKPLPWSITTPADSQEHFLNTLREIYLPHKDEVDGIALSLPGFIDAEQGVVKGGGALSLAYNVGTPVGPRLAEACGCRVWIENDGKAAAIAELERGVLKGCRNAAVFIIGTGVGGGLIIDGKLVRGRDCTAGRKWNM